ncbi:MAG TPA: NfeD family protein [Gemmatimonadaceae bacterium]|jgi:membrane protein implicated in regulation of membrane protease activity
MTVLYLASFVGGLLLAVQIMIAGVERPRAKHPAGERTFRLSPPIIVAFALIFGIVGYLMHQRQTGSDLTQFITAVVLGVISAVIAAQLVRKWWKVTPEHEVDDERYVLQGHLARVTKPIRSDVDGEVVFELGDERRVLKARSLDDNALAAGDDVVIERIENDIAYVESWIEVEKRL